MHVSVLPVLQTTTICIEILSQKMDQSVKDVLTTQLCQYVEDSNKVRDDIDLAALCDAKPYIFGTEGSDRRRWVQKKFDLIKRKRPDRHQKYLEEKLKIPPSAACLREVRHMTKKKSSASNRSHKSSDDSSESDGYDSSLPLKGSHGEANIDWLRAFLRKNCSSTFRHP